MPNGPPDLNSSAAETNTSRGTRRIGHANAGLGSEDRPNDYVLPPDPRASLDRAVRLVWRWRRRFLLAFGACFVLGCAITASIPRQYTARATVIVGFRPPELTTADQVARGPLQAEPDTDGAIELMTSPAALSDIAGQLKLADRPEFQALLQPGPLSALRHYLSAWLRGAPESKPVPNTADLIAAFMQKSLKVERIGHSAFVSIVYSDKDPVEAAAIASVVAGNPVDRNLVKNVPLSERAGITIVQTNVVSSAAVPQQPSSPNLPLMILATTVLSLCVGLSAILLAEYYARQTILGTEDLERRGMRVLGLIPELKKSATPASVMSDVVDHPGSVFAESIASLELSVASIVSSKGCVILLTSAVPSEGKSAIIAALAASMAGNGTHVLLIDADEGAGGPPGRNACAAQKDETGLFSAIELDAGTGVSRVIAGAFRSRLLRSTRMRKMLAEWRELYDVILIDSPPVLSSGDARVLAPLSDHTVLIVRWGKTRSSIVARGVRLLTESGARISGAVLSRVDMSKVSRDDRIYRGKAISVSARRQKQMT